MSASTALPPPNDSSDNGANTMASATRPPSGPSLMSAATPVDQRKANAHGRQHGKDREHRPAHDPDGEHRRADDAQRGRAGRTMHRAVQPGSEGETDDRGGNPVEHRVDDPVLAEPDIEAAEGHRDQEWHREEAD